MNQRNIDRITKICFYINVIGLILYFIWVVLLITGISSIDYSNSKESGQWDKIVLVNYVFYTPAVFLWVYNLRFCYKNDRFSRSLFPLVIFNVFYSPYYYYRVKIKGRPLINEIRTPKEPVIGRTIHLEDYDDESEYREDIKKMK